MFQTQTVPRPPPSGPPPAWPDPGVAGYNIHCTPETIDQVNDEWDPTPSSISSLAWSQEFPANPLSVVDRGDGVLVWENPDVSLDRGLWRTETVTGDYTIVGAYRHTGTTGVDRFQTPWTTTSGNTNRNTYYFDQQSAKAVSSFTSGGTLSGIGTDVLNQWVIIGASITIGGNLTTRHLTGGVLTSAAGTTQSTINRMRLYSRFDGLQARALFGQWGEIAQWPSAFTGAALEAEVLGWASRWGVPTP